MISFVCDDCALNGIHSLCDPKWCDCQHKTLYGIGASQAKPRTGADQVKQSKAA